MQFKIDKMKCQNDHRAKENIYYVCCNMKVNKDCSKKYELQNNKKHITQ